MVNRAWLHFWNVWPITDATAKVLQKRTTICRFPGEICPGIRQAVLLPSLDLSHFVRSARFSRLLEIWRFLFLSRSAVAPWPYHWRWETDESRVFVLECAGTQRYFTLFSILETGTAWRWTSSSPALELVMQETWRWCTSRLLLTLFQIYFNNVHWLITLSTQSIRLDKNWCIITKVRNLYGIFERLSCKLNFWIVVMYDLSFPNILYRF